MGTITQGRDISVFKAVALTIGQAKKPDNDGNINKFVVLTLKNKKALAAPATRHIIFEQDIPGLIDILKKFKADQPDAKGGYLVNIKALKESDDYRKDEDTKELIDQILVWEGGKVSSYDMGAERLANDINNQPVKSKLTGKQVRKRYINVFTQIDYMTTDDEGHTKIEYINGMGLEERGRRLMEQFYRQPAPVDAAATPATDAQAEQDPF